MALTETIVHEDGDLVYLIAPVSPIEPSSAEIEEYAFGPSIVAEQAAQSPNPFIKWYGGHYVEADVANGNGAMWTAKELSIKALTPRFMPVTVMHDPTTAVGLIADVALRTPEKDGVKRAKIETALAVWAHRFPEVVEEAALNYTRGTLMQSMEAIVPEYECGQCGAHFSKLPKGAEQGGWCEHLKQETAARILLATTFTGTGLIFGTRGATGADPLAHLEDFKQEVAEFHQRSQAPSSKRSPRKMDDIQLTKSDYDALQARPTVETLNGERARADKAEKDLEAVEADVVRLTTELATAVKVAADFQEAANKTTLSTERLGKLGNEFLAKLGETTKARINEQAATMQDSEWAERLAELAELVGVAADAKTDPPAAGAPPVAPPGTPVFTPEETARMQVKGAGVPDPTPSLSRGVIEGLIRRPAPAKK